MSFWIHIWCPDAADNCLVVHFTMKKYEKKKKQTLSLLRAKTEPRFDFNV